jgi:uncharacterized protein (DUF1778 family)
MGRPKSVDAKRSVLTMRVTDELQEKLVAAAAANNRSLSKEVENRLEGSFGDRPANQRTTDTFLDLIRAAIADVEVRADSSWLSDLTAWSIVKQAIMREVDLRAPVQGASDLLAAAEALQLEFQTATELVGSLHPAKNRQDEQVSLNDPSNLSHGAQSPNVSTMQRARMQVERVRDHHSGVGRQLAAFDEALQTTGPVEKFGSKSGNDD